MQILHTTIGQQSLQSDIPAHAHELSTPRTQWTLQSKIETIQTSVSITESEILYALFGDDPRGPQAQCGFTDSDSEIFSDSSSVAGHFCEKPQRAVNFLYGDALIKLVVSELAVPEIEAETRGMIIRELMGGREVIEPWTFERERRDVLIAMGPASLASIVSGLETASDEDDEEDEEEDELTLRFRRMLQSKELIAK